MAKFGDGGDLVKCSFCGKSQKQVKKLIAGPGVYICDECIDLCNDIIAEELAETPEFSFEELPKPREIFDFLNDYVIGQEYAKKILSVAVYNHYKRVQAGTTQATEVELAKSNILLLGPTGCGKTLLGPDPGPHAQRALRHRRRHGADRGRATWARTSRTSSSSSSRRPTTTSSGPRRGSSTSTRSTRSPARARTRRSPVTCRARACSRRCSRSSRGRRRRCRPRAAGSIPHQEFIQIDTTNILFICGGAFAGLDKIIESRIGRKGIGFRAEVRRSTEARDSEVLRHVLPEDLIKFGLIPEFIGRLPVVGAVSSLDKDALIRILVEPKNALVKQYRRVFELDGVELEFGDDALEAVAEQALLRGTGARGLRAILEEVLLEVMYDLPSRTDVGKCVIDRAVVLDRVQPDARAPKRAGQQGAHAPGRFLSSSVRRCQSRTDGDASRPGRDEMVAWLDSHTDYELAMPTRVGAPTLGSHPGLVPPAR